MKDTELEQHIKDCGQLLETAYNDRNHEDAQLWQAAMFKAIKARSPERVAYLESCYFTERGEADRLTSGVINHA